jgi:hypothetical protein
LIRTLFSTEARNRDKTQRKPQTLTDTLPDSRWRDSSFGKQNRVS